MTATISSGAYSVRKQYVLNVCADGEVIEKNSERIGLSLDDARALVALMRRCSFKAVSIYDPDVLVLTEEETSEDQIIAALASFMEFMEVPRENEFLGSQLGDVVGLKKGEAETINNMLGNLTSGVYWGQVSGIAAKALDSTYYVAGVYTDENRNSYCTGVIAYSLSKYCQNNAKPGKDMQTLAANTAMYGYYANIYFSNK